jgi:hypothetical protein
MRFQLPPELIQFIVKLEGTYGNVTGNITQITSLQEVELGSPTRNMCAVSPFCRLHSDSFRFIVQCLLTYYKLNGHLISRIIHSSGLVYATATLPQNISIGPSSIVEGWVSFGKNTVNGAGGFIERHSPIGHVLS